MKYTYILSLTLLLQCHAYAGILFSDQTSQVTVADGATLHTSGALQVIKGTVDQEGEGALTGTACVFSRGILIRNGKKAFLTGSYDAAANATISLTGKSTLDAGRNFAVNALEVSGADNVLAGFPVLMQPLVLDEGVDITCDLAGQLTKTISLNGGTLTLAHDIQCASDASFAGTGTIDCKGFVCTFAPYYAQPLAGTLTWHNAANIKLKGQTALQGAWTLQDNAKIDGNGETLDLRGGGKLVIPAGATVTLRDIQVRGVSQESVVFGDASSQLRLEQATLHLKETMTIAEGGIYVADDTTFVLKSHDLIFDSSASLTVDGSTLSLNVFNNVSLSDGGTIKAPHPLFIDHVKQVSLIAQNKQLGTYTVLNGGGVAEIGERDSDQLFSSNIEGNLILEQSTVMGPNDVIHITKDTTIDGKGARIMFARPKTPQFIIDPGVTVTLKNLELYGIINTTFKVGTDAKIAVGENVIWSLSDDIEWNKEVITLTGQTDIMTIRGIGCPRRFTIASSQQSGLLPHQYVYEQHLALGSNSLVIDNLVLRGTRYISFSTQEVASVSVVGSIVLAGDATIELDEPLTDHHFTVKDLGNRIHCLLGSTTLAGEVAFDHSRVSALSIRFVLPATFKGTPRLLCRSKAMQLLSQEGQACLYFENHDIDIENEAADSFSIGENAYLQGRRITIFEHPLQQTSSHAVIVPGTLLRSSLDSGALVHTTLLLDIMKGFAIDVRPTTAFALRQLDEMLDAQEDTHKDEDLLRGISLPDKKNDTILNYASALSLSPFAGNIIVRDDEFNAYTNASVDPVRALNLTMQDGVIIEQKTTEDFVLKYGDIMNVQGGTQQQPNIVQLTKGALLAGDLKLDNDAVLRLHFSEKNPEPLLTIADSFTCDFGNNAVLCMSGNGVVVLPRSWIINFAATDGMLVLQEGVKVVVDDGDLFALQGTGTLRIEKGAHLVINPGGVLRCGQSSTDALTCDVRTGGCLQVGSLFSGEAKTARFSSVGKNKLHGLRMGNIVLGNGGILECNGYEGVSVPSSLEEIDISFGGSLYIASQAALQIHEGGVDGMVWNSVGGVLSGTGVIQYESSAFAGQMQNTAFSQTGMSAASMVSALVQTNSALVATTAFTDASGAKKLYTKNGAIVTLEAADEVFEESADGAISGYNSTSGQFFTYDADGERG